MRWSLSLLHVHSIWCYFSLLDLTDSDTITELLRQAGGEGTLLHQSPDRDLPLTPADLHSVSIDLDEFESARAKSKSL